MPQKPPETEVDYSVTDTEDFTPQEKRVAEAYIELVRRQTKLTYRYLRDIVAERGADDGS